MAVTRTLHLSRSLGRGWGSKYVVGIEGVSGGIYPIGWLAVCTTSECYQHIRMFFVEKRGSSSHPTESHIPRQTLFRSKQMFQ